MTVWIIVVWLAGAVGPTDTASVYPTHEACVTVRDGRVKAAATRRGAPIEAMSDCIAVRVDKSFSIVHGTRP